MRLPNFLIIVILASVVRYEVIFGESAQAIARNLLQLQPAPLTLQHVVFNDDGTKVVTASSAAAIMIATYFSKSTLPLKQL